MTTAGGTPTTPPGANRPAASRLRAATPCSPPASYPLRMRVRRRIDRAFVLPHRECGLGDRQALQEAQDDALLLIGVELLARLEQRGVLDRVEDLALRPVLGSVRVEHVGGCDLELVAARLVV